MNGNFLIKKRLGQNFLKSSNICRKIVQAANINGGVVLEIGPGFGALTKELLKKADKVVAVEKDKDLIPILQETFKDELKLHILHGDFLDLNLEEIVKENLKYGSFKICANVPYYITSPIIVKILKCRLQIKSITLMLQKEAAYRICAPPGSRNCGAISVFVRYFAVPHLLFEVSKGNFFPKPQVDSAVVKLCINYERIYVKNEVNFFRLVRAAFSQRRKMLVNPVSSEFKIKKIVLEDMLKSLCICSKLRAEHLTLNQFISIANMLEEVI